MQRVFRSPVLVQVSGRADQVARYFAQPLHSERSPGLDGDADGSVETFPDHIGHRVAQMQIDRYLGEGGQKVRQQRRHLQRAKGHGNRQTHQSPRGSSLSPGNILGCLTLGEDLGGATHQLSSGICQLKAAGGADDQPRTEPRLDPADRL